jgi:hypothetical protein
MNLDWKLIRSIWVALLVPALIVAGVWGVPLAIEKWERYQHSKKIRKCEADMEKDFGRNLSLVEALELSRWCTHRAAGGVFDDTYKPVLPSLWKEYYARHYPGSDPCKVHLALCGD